MSAQKLVLTLSLALLACATPVDPAQPDPMSQNGTVTPAADAGVGADASSSSQEEASLPDAAPPPGGLSLAIVGNHFVDGNNKTVRLLGVNRSGAEFECIQGGTQGSLGWGIFDGPTDVPSAQAIAKWHATAVRIPLNEDCWLGINGVNPMYGGANYRKAVTDYVNALHQAGLYAIVDLHWNAPGGIAAAAQQPLPDADHAIDFWKSVATTFASDPAIVFDLYNEPFVYGNYMQNQNGDPWSCWLNGCGLNQYLTGEGNPYTKMVNWNSVGMQKLVDTVRATGSTNPIMVAGLDWANDLSGWLAHMPVDPKNQLAASWHSYPGQPCMGTCRTTVMAPIAAKVPVVIGEIGDTVCSSTTFVDGIVPWADTLGISYLGWTWNTWQNCDNVLIADFNGTPTSNYGKRFHDLMLLSNP